GLHQARKAVALAEAAGMACVAVSPYETALGAAANLHLAATSTAFPFAAELGVGVSSVALEGSASIVVENACALLAEGAGLGFGVPASLFGAASPPIAGAVACLLASRFSRSGIFGPISMRMGKPYGRSTG